MFYVIRYTIEVTERCPKADTFIKNKRKIINRSIHSSNFNTSRSSERWISEHREGGQKLIRASKIKEKVEKA